MIEQPGNTDLSNEEVKGQFRQAFVTIFGEIEKYHDILGCPITECNKRDKVEQHRQFVLAAIAESIELLDAAPWKPWRPVGYKETDEINLMEEMIDIIFFLGSLRKLWNLSPEKMADILERKLIENYRRISIGYNRTAEEMGNG